MATSSTIALDARTSEDLLARLNELEETLRAIRQGEVDAPLVSTSEGDRVFTLQGADHPYRVMVEAINEGAATVSTRGEILYANRRFAQMLAVIEITDDLPADMPRLPREIEVALFRVVQESLENVRRHSGSKTAEIRLARQDGGVLLEVKDQGAGMPTDLFTEPAASVAGLGVGVAGMRERLRHLGGQLQIKSGKGGGTTVRATVPVAKSEGPKASRAGGAPLRVLIVDDAEVMRRSVRAIFELEPGVVVVGEAANGHEAIERTVELQPDIVVLDLSMPDMDGLEASSQIHVVTPSARILVLSQDDSPEAIVGARNAGAVGYVLKSDAARDLMVALKAVSQGKTFLSSTAAKLVPPESL